MKIAIFSDFFYPEMSGVVESIMMTGAELTKHGHKVEFFAPHYSNVDYSKINAQPQEVSLGKNVVVHRALSFSVPSPSLQGRGYIPNIFRGFFKKNKFDIIHSHGFWGAGIDSLCLAKITGAPLIGTNHTHIESFMEYLPINNSLTRKATIKYLMWFYNRCDLLTTPTNFLLEDMRGKGLKVDNTIVSNPINKKFFGERNKSELKKKLSLPGFTFLYAGRISSEKNVLILLDTFIDFAKKHRDACLVFVGGGTYRQRMEDTITKSSLSSQIRIVGPYMGEQKETFYDYFYASDAFVMPSTSETQSMTTLEAMASGLPIIAAKAAALPEVVGHGRGLLFEPNNKAQLEEQMETLYQKKVDTVEMISSAKMYANDRSPEKIAIQWENIYQEVISKHNKYNGKSQS